MLCTNQNDLTSEMGSILELQVSICLYISFSTEIIALDKGLTEHWGAVIINLPLEGCLWSLGMK